MPDYFVLTRVFNIYPEEHFWGIAYEAPILTVDKDYKFADLDKAVEVANRFLESEATVYVVISYLGAVLFDSRLSNNP